MRKILLTCCFYLLFINSYCQEFISTWNTAKSLSDTTSYIKLPCSGTGYSIYWEEIGNPSYKGTLVGDSITNVYFGKKGYFRVKISGGNPAFNRINFFDNDTSAYALRSIEQWGNIQWSSMVGAFSNCTNLSILPLSPPDLGLLTDMSYMFYNCAYLNSNISNWNTSGIYNMSHLFDGCKRFNQPLDSWNVNNVIDMSFMFNSNIVLNYPLNNWNVSNVTNMSYMFSGTKFSMNVSGWHINNVIDMSGMFSGASSFNDSIANWNVANVVDMSYMFSEAIAFKQDISNWNVSNVTNMSYMFNNTNFNINLSNWDVSNVTKMSGMFQKCSFNQPIGNWNTHKVFDMSFMFYGSAFNMDISNWNTSNVIDMKYMFSYNNYFNQPIGNWNTSKVLIMKSLFANSVFNQPIGNWNTSKVTNMSYMFASSVFNQPIGNWNTGKVTDMTGMFLSSPFNQPIGSWNTSNVTTMNAMLYEATSFNQNLSNWNVAKVNAIGLSYTKISNNRYDSIITSWSSQPVKTGVMLSAIGLRFCDSKVQRNYLIASKGWAISGDSIRIGCILPITLTSFTATPQQNKILLQWQTATEINNNFFTVQRSSSNDNWQDIAIIKGSVNSSTTKTYNNTDNNPMNGINYYRIKQTDNNGSFTYSPIKQVTINDKQQMASIYPNPAKDVVNISCVGMKQIKIINPLGQTVQQFNNISIEHQIVNTKQLPKGVYAIVVQTANGTVTKTLVKE